MSTSDRIEKTQKKFMAYLFYDKKYIASILGKINKEHLPKYSDIYGLLITYYQKHKDVITDYSAEMLFQKKNIGVDQVVKYKTSMSELRTMLFEDGVFIGNEAEFNSIVEELQEIKKRKDYLKIAEIIVDSNPTNCSTEKLEEMEQVIKKEIVSITSTTSEVRKEGTIVDSAQSRLDGYFNVKNNPSVLKAVPTGFVKIDEANGGFRAGELVYVIGRKGDGKSVALLNFAHNAWIAGHNVIIFTLEISKEDYERRFDARAAGVSSNGLKMGKLQTLEEKMEMDRVSDIKGVDYTKDENRCEEDIYRDYIENLKKGLVREPIMTGKEIKYVKPGTVYIVDCPSGCTPAFIESKLDSVEQLLNVKFDVVVTDYAGIMRPNVPVAEKRHEQGQIALDQKRIARERDCIVISAAQMTREGGKSKEADTSHVAESDQVSDHIDWGIAVKSASDTTGIMSSFKTRDAAPFSFHFTKKYSQMKIIELEDGLAEWDGLMSPM